jgi:hypothetical protein
LNFHGVFSCRKYRPWRHRSFIGGGRSGKKRRGDTYGTGTIGTNDSTGQNGKTKTAMTHFSKRYEDLLRDLGRELNRVGFYKYSAPAGAGAV